MDGYGGGAQLLDLGGRRSLCWMDTEHWLQEEAARLREPTNAAADAFNPVSAAQGWTGPAQADLLLSFVGQEIAASPAVAGHDDGGGLVLDWQLRVRPVAFAAARAFVGQYHVHCGPPVTWRYGYAAFNGMTLLGVLYGVALSSCFAQRSPVFIHASLTHGPARLIAVL